MLLNGTVMLDMDASSLEQISDLVLDNMVNSGYLPFDSKEKVRRYLFNSSKSELGW